MNDVVNKHAAMKDDDGLCSLSFNVAPQEASHPPKRATRVRTLYIRFHIFPRYSTSPTGWSPPAITVKPSTQGIRYRIGVFLCLSVA